MKKILSLVLVLALMLSFASCTKKAEFFEENLKEADYTVTVVDDEEKLKAFAENLEGDLEYVISAFKLDGEYVSIACFAKSADAKKAMEDAEKEDGDIVVERKGRVVIVASSDAALDAALGK